MPTIRDLKSGRFVRKHKIWDGSNWDDGYSDTRRRFRVYRPDYPRAYGHGYALRAHVVWWLANGEIHEGELHHINKDTLDDRLENLKLMSNSDHQRHHKERLVEFECEHCHRNFKVKAWRLKQRRKEGRKIKFCSQECFRLHPRKKKRIEMICMQCKHPFYVIPSQATSRKFCSPRCSALYRWSRE